MNFNEGFIEELDKSSADTYVIYNKNYRDPVSSAGFAAGIIPGMVEASKDISKVPKTWKYLRGAATGAGLGWALGYGGGGAIDVIKKLKRHKKRIGVTPMELTFSKKQLNELGL